MKIKNLQQVVTKLLSTSRIRSQGISAPLIASIAILISLYTINKSQSMKAVTIYNSDKEAPSANRIIDNSTQIYQLQEKVFEKQLKDIQKSHSQLKDEIKSLRELLRLQNKEEETSKEKEKDQDKKETKCKDSKGSKTKKNTPVPKVNIMASKQAGSVFYHEPSANYTTGKSRSRMKSNRRYKHIKPRKKNTLITFPSNKTKQKEKHVNLPAGSYVKTKLLVGVNAPENKPTPTLLQADYAFIGPNKTSIDLSGCFIIAKTSSNISMERVEMQAIKISCVSKSGKMFETKINGFVADGSDNSFGVKGELNNSRQGRLATMSFLSSVVEGVGKAIKQAQTTNLTASLGNSSSIVDGDQIKHSLAGGASNAAGSVASWYLEHAKKLQSYLTVESGQDVYFVLQDSVKLPSWYFKQPK